MRARGQRKSYIKPDAYPGFDLTRHPLSYADFADPASAILAGTKGEQRRRDAQRAIEEGADLPTQPLVPVLPSSERRRLADRDPRYLGGEYLPPDLPGEVTIARIAFRTMTWHVIEIRARQVEDRYHYRIVDDDDSLFVPILDWSVRPLTLGQLLTLFEESHGITGHEGLVIPVLDAVFPEVDTRDSSSSRESAGDRRAKADAIRAFVTVTSDFYADLESIYRMKVEEWMAERGYPEEVPRRSAQPARDSISAARSHPDTLEGSIDRLLRAWWMTHDGPLAEDEGMALGRRALRLRAFLHEHAAEYGRLPAGVIRLVQGSEAWSVDLDDLTETGELIERVLREGEEVDVALLEWIPFASEQLTVYRYGDRLYLAHPGGLDGPFEEVEEYEDYFHDYLHDEGELVAQLDWDSGGPGAGAGISRVYRAFGMLFVSDDFGLSEPYDDYEHAVRQHGIYTVNDATTRIWDAEHGLVFERGVLYKPEAVERYGAIYVDPKSIVADETSDPYPPGRDIAEGVMRRQ